MSNESNNKKAVFAWTMYDWANSVFSLTIATAVFPIYFNKMCKAASEAQGGYVNGVHHLNIFGLNVIGTELYSYVISASFLIVACISPLLSGIADYKQNKKFFLKLFCYLGSASCISLYFFNSSNIELGVILFMLSLIGFSGSIVFYNAFLPEITNEENYDKISARGFAMGYMGSVILLIINLMIILKVDWFFPIQEKANALLQNGLAINLEEALQKSEAHYGIVGTKLAFVSVGIWWAGFAQFMFAWVPEKNVVSNHNGTIFLKGFQEIKKVFYQVNSNKTMRMYLLGFFFTSMGVQTVMYVASLFGEEELKLTTDKLIGTILIIQLIAIAGAFMFSKISSHIGNIKTLSIMSITWIAICIYAYQVQTDYQFYILAIVVGTVMGGIQSMLRSTYAKIIPDNTTDTASFFSFYDVFEKLAVVIGTLSFGLINGITGNMRESIIALAIYFIIGLFFITRVKNFKTMHP